jgi:hypothetical protein
MPAWEYELFLKEINALVKEENEKNQEEQGKYNHKDLKKMSNPNYIKNMNNKAMDNFKMPSMPKMPNL